MIILFKEIKLLNNKKNLQKLIENIPNLLTISRFFLVLPLIFFLETNHTFYIFILIFIAGLTDYFDGLIARKLNLRTRLGAVLDPLSDKVFLLVSLVFLCKNNLIPFWSLSIVIFRELVISSFRNSSEDGLPATQLGKYKTFSFFISLLFFFFPSNKEFIHDLALLFYWLGFTLALITFIDYLRIKKKII